LSTWVVEIEGSLVAEASGATPNNLFFEVEGSLEGWVLEASSSGVLSRVLEGFINGLLGDASPSGISTSLLGYIVGVLGGGDGGGAPLVGVWAGELSVKVLMYILLFFALVIYVSRSLEGLLMEGTNPRAVLLFLVKAVLAPVVVAIAISIINSTPDIVIVVEDGLRVVVR